MSKQMQSHKYKSDELLKMMAELRSAYGGLYRVHQLLLNGEAVILEGDDALERDAAIRETSGALCHIDNILARDWPDDPLVPRHVAREHGTCAPPRW